MRIWLHQRLVADPALRDILFAGDDPLPDDAEDSVYGSHSLEGVPERKPFVVHDMGNDTSERLSDDSTAHRQFVTIYVHDVGYDYTRIDQVIAELKSLLNNPPSAPGFGVMTCHYLETSRDLEDDQMGTIVKYARFQIIGT